MLVFAYAVQAGDEDDNGIFLYNDGNSDLGGDGVISLSTSMIVAKDTTTAANIAFASGGGLQASHKVDGTTTTSAATVTSVSLTSTPPYFTDDVIEVSVVFSEAVTVDTTSGTPSHQIGIDPRGARDAPYDSGSGTTTLVFRYTVETEDQDDDGVFLRDGATDGALELNSGTITAGGVAAVVNAYGGRGLQAAHTVNTPPTITALRVVSTPMLADDTYGVDEAIRFEVEFDQVVVVSGRPRFELGIPPAPPDRELADYDDGSGTTTLVFVYVVQADDVDTDGVYTGISPAVEHAGGSTIQSEASGRDAVLTHSITPVHHAGHKVDGSRSVVTGPTPVNTAPVAANDNVATGAGEAVTIEVLSNDRDAEDDTLTVASVTSPTSGTAAPTADHTRVVYTPRSGFTGTVRFTYTVSDGDATATATVIVTVGVARVGTDICGRTAAVRTEILRVLTLAVSPGYDGTCAGVTADWLARATYLEFQVADGRVTRLRRGDFAGLTGVRRLSFVEQPLTSLPAGVFDGLTSLRSLTLERGQLASLAPGVFDPLRGLTELVLSDNRLRALGSGVFDGLTALEWLDLRNNRLERVPLAELEKLPALTRLLTQGNPGTRYRVEVSPPAVTVEQGGTTSYRVRLMRPGITQGSTVRPTPASASAGVRVAPERLTFAPANWFRSREVTVTAAGDATLGPVRIAHRASGKFSPNTPEVRVQVVPGAARATAADAPATIEGAPVVSDPGADGAWTPGEAVEVTLTFSEAVTVTTGGGTPAIGLRLNGTAERAAAYARGSRTGSLVFRYPVAEADGPVSSVIVPPNTLVLNGGAIAGATGVAADRSHVGAARLGRVEEPPEDPAVRNTAATGAPAIGGTAQVDETLTASTSDIADADGLDHARFAYQWIRGSSDIQGATGSRYTLASADEGQRITVRVSFTDDAGNPESLTSAATDAVEAAPPPLTASFSGVPAEHGGEGETFTFGLTFSEEFGLSYTTVRDEALDVSGGTVRKAKRQEPGSNLSWTIHVEPASHGPVTIRLPAGSVETADGRALSNAPSATVAGPVGIAVADARVDENDGAHLAFVVTLSRAASGTLTVDYATADGSAQAGVDYTAANGTLTFRAGEASRTIEVTVLDDVIDEGEETLTLTLSHASGGRLTDAEATGTIVNRDPLPRALLARFGRTAAGHVVEQVEARLQAPRAPGFEGRVAGRQLRRGMEREMALEFLNRLGGAAGMHAPGGGVRRPMAGSGVAGVGALGTPGLGGGGLGMPGAAGAMGAPNAGMMSIGAGAMGAAAGPDGGLLGGGLSALGLGPPRR